MESSQSLSRLAIFLHPLFSDGGVERTNIFLARGLIERGYTVKFLTTEATKHFREELDEAGIQLIELGKGRTLSHSWEIVRHIISASRRYKRVYLISCQYYVNVVAMLVAMMVRGWSRNVRFINSERNHFEEFAVRGGAKSRLILFLVRRLYRLADVVVANSKETADDLSELLGRKVYCVYNPTINERIDALKNEPINEVWFIKDRRATILGIGRLSKQKDFRTLINAYSLIADKINAKLVILGEGELRVELERQIEELELQDSVYLPGFVDNPYKFLAASELFVLSSRYEGMPNALIEAVYLGIPCISTACRSGPSEVLLDGMGGGLVPVLSEVKMAEAMLAALSNGEKSNRLAAVALRGAVRFRYENIVEDFERVINL